MKIYIIFTLLCARYALAEPNFFIGHYEGYDIPPPVETASTREVTTNYFLQMLDHFDPTNTALWQQRYFVNDQYFNATESKAVFLLLGGEGQASAQWMTYGAWVQSAAKYGALLIQLEHRYYGQSHPYNTLATANLRYLSSQQALEDTVNFISAMNVKYNLPSDVKWILFGGSYSASLAAWARQKYPHLVQGAMASSGPIFAKLDFHEYLDVVANGLALHSQECVDTVREGFNQLEYFISNPGQENLTSLFNLCYDFEDETNKTPNNIAYLFERLSSPIAGVVQYTGIPGQTTIATICNILTNEETGREIDRLAQLSGTFYSNCLNYRFEDLVTSMSRTTITASGNMRQWYYQTCTEYGWYQSTSTEKEVVFGSRNPVEFFTQLCTDVFGSHFDANYTTEQNERINRHYGGYDGEVTNVVHVQGSLDPWYPMGLVETANPASPVIFINGTSHCANLYNPSVNDIPQLTEAREEVDRLIGEWLGISTAVRVQWSVLMVFIGFIAKLL